MDRYGLHLFRPARGVVIDRRITWACRDALPTLFQDVTPFQDASDAAIINTWADTENIAIVIGQDCRADVALCTASVIGWQFRHLCLSRSKFKAKALRVAVDACISACDRSMPATEQPMSVWFSVWLIRHAVRRQCIQQMY